MDRANWVADVQFIPSLWMHPLAKDQAGCEKAKGNYLVGTIQGYDRRPNDNGSDSHFFSFLVSETNLTEAQVYHPGEGGGKGEYVPTPFVPNEFYSLRAPGNLMHQLKKYATDANFTGVPLEITYTGLKEVEVDNPKKPGTKMKAITHQYQVRRDPSWVALPDAKPVMLLEGPAAGDGG